MKHKDRLLAAGESGERVYRCVWCCPCNFTVSEGVRNSLAELLWTPMGRGTTPMGSSQRRG